MDTNAISTARLQNLTSILSVSSAALGGAIVGWYIGQCQTKTDDEKCRNNVKAKEVNMRTPLRNTSPLLGESSRIVYLTGLDKETTRKEIVDLFSRGGSFPVEIDLSEVSFHKGGGRAWALYENPEDAKRTIPALHQTTFRGCTLCARLELGVEKDGRRITYKGSHTAIVRDIKQRRGTQKKAKSNKSGPIMPAKAKRNHNDNGMNDNLESLQVTSSVSVTYSHKSISVGQIEYPFPSGIYLTELIKKLSKNKSPGTYTPQEQNLLYLLADISKVGGGSLHCYAKEVSEAFAMVDATERAIKLVFQTAACDLNRAIICYCLGDGKYPVCAAALALAMPKTWKFVSIDPILDTNWNDTTQIPERISLFPGVSQNYQIPKASNKIFANNHEISIVIACHSHAPLEEFWERMPKPRVCIAMPCCAQFSELPEEIPCLQYHNYEVYSPKRHIKIFGST